MGLSPPTTSTWSTTSTPTPPPPGIKLSNPRFATQVHPLTNRARRFITLYHAPEHFERCDPEKPFMMYSHSPKADIRALGATLLALYSVYPEREAQALQQKDTDAILRQTYFKALQLAARKLPRGVSALTGDMLQQKPHHRPSSRECLCHVTRLICEATVASGECAF